MEIKSKSQKKKKVKEEVFYEIAKSNKLLFLRNKQPQPEPFSFLGCCCSLFWEEKEEQNKQLRLVILLQNLDLEKETVN
ncbi:hypothetical protein M0811_11057 [Anaeramoeba ignava]|uniref:Uncharacterized protein n=1 Tax=Anaeramoeba ignava TaxID=1746090 RepID=A0A9Q0LD26_ANAIG|nr:hypothetical protein M0811_11057 [Anaeramoeba ignava]